MKKLQKAVYFSFKEHKYSKVFNDEKIVKIFEL